MMKTRAINEEILYPAEAIVKVNAADVASWKVQALQNDRQRIRLCAHRDENDNVHEMLIVHTHDTYVRPHKHQNKTESFHVIEGIADVIIFDENGNIIDIIPMGNYDSGRCFYYRLADPIYHTLIIHSEVLVFHEATQGPFKREDTVFAPWSPDIQDTDGIKAFIKKITNSAKQFGDIR